MGLMIEVPEGKVKITYCKLCGETIVNHIRSEKSRTTNYCSTICQCKDYYYNHKETMNEQRKTNRELSYGIETESKHLKYNIGTVDIPIELKILYAIRRVGYRLMQYRGVRPLHKDYLSLTFNKIKKGETFYAYE